MEILNLPNEVLFSIADFLSTEDLSILLSVPNLSLSSVLTPYVYTRLSRNVDGPTPLKWATKHGHARLVELAISRGAEVDKPGRGRNGRTPLYSAAKHNHPDVIRTLVEHGACINAKDRHSETPLHLAAERGKEKAIKALLELGADMMCAGDSTNLPAHLGALWYGGVECIKPFIDAGFDIGTKNKDGRTMIHEAVLGWGLRKLNYLLGLEGAPMAINAQDCNGLTALHYASNHDRDDFDAEFVWPLLRYGADMTLVDNYGETPVHSAVCGENIARVGAYLDAGFDFYTRGRRYGETVLHTAATRDTGKVMEYLLGRKGAHLVINAQNYDESTPLHIAMAGTSKPKMAKLLLDHGADMGARDSYANCPAHIAAYRGNVPCMEVLLDAGFDISTRGNFGQTILHQAVFGGIEMVEYLLGQRGGAVMINAQDLVGLTPLHLAASKCHGPESPEAEAIMRLLTRYGADTEMGNKDGYTPADIAAYCKGRVKSNENGEK